MQPVHTPPPSHLENVVSEKTVVLKKFDDILGEIDPNHFYPISLIQKLLANYTATELELLLKDFNDIRETTFQNVERERTYHVTAGSPGSGKSTLLEKKLLEEKRKSAYVDPDRRALFHMKRTYSEDIEQRKRTAHEAYTHWRDASNFIANTLLAIALKEGYAISHGSTMTAPQSRKALDAIHGDYKYNVCIYHITCPDSVRIASERQRQQGGTVQCTEADLINKGKLFFDRLPDYVQTADTIELYYRSEVDVVTLAATKEGKDLFIHDTSAYDAIKALHNEMKGEGYWEREFEATCS